MIVGRWPKFVTTERFHDFFAVKIAKKFLFNRGKGKVRCSADQPSCGGSQRSASIGARSCENIDEKKMERITRIGH